MTIVIDEAKNMLRKTKKKWKEIRNTLNSFNSFDQIISSISVWYSTNYCNDYVIICSTKTESYIQLKKTVFIVLEKVPLSFEFISEYSTFFFISNRLYKRNTAFFKHRYHWHCCRWKHNVKQQKYFGQHY